MIETFIEVALNYASVDDVSTQMRWMLCLIQRHNLN